MARLLAKHLLSELPAAVAADLQLTPCPRCGLVDHTVRGRRGLTSLVAHADKYRHNQLRRHARAASPLPTPAPRPAGAAAPIDAATASFPTENTKRYLAACAECMTAGEAFLA